MRILESICKDLALIREKRPLIHSITNLVVMNETVGKARDIPCRTLQRPLP